MLKVAYLANQYPAAVEPYVSREIDALRMRGVEVIPGSIRRPESTTDCSRPFEGELICLRPIRIVVLLKAMRLLFRRRKGISPLVRRVLTQGRETPWRRIKALAHTALGACYAVRLRERGVDHIHVHHGYFGCWVAMAAARLLEVDFSITLHGSDLLVHNAYLDTKLNLCSFCLTVSEYNRRYILEHFRIDPRKVLVFRLGVDLPENHQPLIPASNGKITLVSAGRLRAVKDHSLLVRACARLRDRGIDLECLIAGEGPERRRIESQIRKLRISDSVTLLGHVARQQMDSLYRRADAVVLTSQSEGIPLVLMEAMAAGRIVLAPAITGIPELLIPEKTGFLYEPGSLDDLVARLVFICGMLRRGKDHPHTSRLSWIRHAARCQILHNFNRKKNLDHFVDRFVELAARNWSPPHADPLLQQIQLPVQRDRGVPVRSHGTDAVEGTRGRVILHGRSAG
ncbi:MAG TPA: glycosyltransferase family 4 protein [Candidatus Aquilonibacter sp.]|nr:glycosyltransferase family 4 protein [Candidatus Aquilonibacter sp.]